MGGPCDEVPRSARRLTLCDVDTIASPQTRGDLHVGLQRSGRWKQQHRRGFLVCGLDRATRDFGAYGFPDNDQSSVGAQGATYALRLRQSRRRSHSLILAKAMAQRVHLPIDVCLQLSEIARDAYSVRDYLISSIALRVVDVIGSAAVWQDVVDTSRCRRLPMRIRLP